MGRVRNYQPVWFLRIVRGRAWISILWIRLHLAWHISIAGEHTHSHMTYITCHFTRHLARGIDAFFLVHLSRAAFAPWILFSESVSNPKRQSIASPYGPPSPYPPSSPCVLFYGAQCKLPKDWKQHGQPCVLRASGRWIIIVSCLTQPRPHVMRPPLSRARPRKAQIAKNNIAVDGEGENNRIGGDAGGCGGGGGGGAHGV